MITKRTFFDLARLKKRAAREAKGATGNSFLANWWSKKYGLPPNHELFTSRTPASLYQEYFEWLHERRDELQSALQEARGQERFGLIDQITSITAILEGQENAGPMVTGDALVDEWEEMLDRGAMPDLEADIDPRILERFKK